MEAQEQLNLQPFYNAVAKRVVEVKKTIKLNADTQLAGARYKDSNLVAENLYSTILQDLIGLTPEELDKIPEEGVEFQVDPAVIDRALSSAIIESGHHDQFMIDCLHKLAQVDREVVMNPLYN